MSRTPSWLFQDEHTKRWVSGSPDAPPANGLWESTDTDGRLTFELISVTCGNQIRIPKLFAPKALTLRKSCSYSSSKTLFGDLEDLIRYQSHVLQSK